MAYSVSNVDNKIDNIRENIQRGVNDIEDYAQQHAERDPEDEYEQALLDMTNDLEQSVHAALEDIRQLILSRRPAQTDPNYLEKKQQYSEYVQHATTGLNRLKASIRSLFTKLVGVVKRVVQWVRDHREGIYTFISNAFRVIIPLLGAFVPYIPHF
ncbi:unnamed protein product [Adineta steineri]|uniref:Uncharacterized protein n=1 Tax=Adineta steineri TaxID=433720 RepID=A0A815K068_9BILA|nr:unnamed protein product [Adineta steineri]CAF1383402.1 unnamed protein product [Adineta steineri]